MINNEIWSLIDVDVTLAQKNLEPFTCFALPHNSKYLFLHRFNDNIVQVIAPCAPLDSEETVNQMRIIDCLLKK